VNEKEVVRLYVDDKLTLRNIAEIYKTDHHRIHRVLLRNGIVLNRSNRAIVRRKCKPRTTKRKPNSVKIVHTEATNRRNMARKLKTTIDLDRYQDFFKLRFLTRVLARQRKHMGFEDTTRKTFLDKFYFQSEFNRLYDQWIDNGRNKWWMPSLDHKMPRSRNGDWSLHNLQFLTWFENKAKADMTDEEWSLFKQATNTTSSLFS
jgi:hypothetical protein